MNTSSAPRREMHRRQIDMHAFLRDDGLWDIEAELGDTKPFTYQDHRRGTLEPGHRVHGIWVRLTIDDQLLIKAVELRMPDTPFTTCTEVGHSLDPLIAQRIGPGWAATVRELVPRRSTCTHVAELLVPMASCAYQSLAFGPDPARYGRLDLLPSGERAPFFVNGCHGWRADGPNVRALFPRFATGGVKEG